MIVQRSFIGSLDRPLARAAALHAARAAKGEEEEEEEEEEKEKERQRGREVGVTAIVSVSFILQVARGFDLKTITMSSTPVQLASAQKMFCGLLHSVTAEFVDPSARNNRLKILDSIAICESDQGEISCRPRRVESTASSSFHFSPVPCRKRSPSTASPICSARVSCQS